MAEKKNNLSQPQDTKITNRPNKRFPGFTGEWEVKKLGEIATFSKGKGISKNDISDNGATECIRYGELYTHYDEVISEIKSSTNIKVDNLVLSEQNDVIIPASGESQIDIATASCVLKSNVALGGDLNIIKTPNNGVFLSYYMNSSRRMDIARLAQGISVVHLYASQLSLLKICLPPLQEQQKLASFLSLLDERISTQRKIIEELRALKISTRKKIFSQSIIFKKNVGGRYPQWKKVALKEILDYEQPTKFLVSDSEYNDAYDIPVLTAGKTFLLGYTNEKEGVFKEQLPTIIFDDFTTAFQYVDFPFKAKSSARRMLVPKSTDVNLQFVFEAMKTIQFPLAEHKRYWISEYQNEKILYPCKEEQQKIAQTLSAIDQKIELEKQYLDLLKQQKQYLLQNLFV